jgi:anti-sigma B factor antagonist
LEAFGTITSRKADTAVVSVRGEVDLYTAPQLWETIDAAIAEVPAELVIDLTHVRFLDSTGLNLLVRAHKRLRPTGATVVVRGARADIYRSLELTRLNKVFTVEAAAR